MDGMPTMLLLSGMAAFALALLNLRRSRNLARACLDALHALLPEQRELTMFDAAAPTPLVLMLLGRPPVVGDSVRFDRLSFEVTAVKGHGVEECAVTLLTDVDAGPSEGVGL